jgi:hypothetical protein
MIGHLGGHLGASVSALVDGQLDPQAEERAWAHVMECVSCREQVEREGWLKRRLAQIGEAEPPAQLVGSLFQLTASAAEEAHAWATVEALEQRSRTRRRAGLVLVGAGSVSAAVLGIATLSGMPLGSDAPAPETSLTRSTASASPSATTRSGVTPTAGGTLREVPVVARVSHIRERLHRGATARSYLAPTAP